MWLTGSSFPPYQSTVTKQRRKNKDLIKQVQFPQHHSWCVRNNKNRGTETSIWHFFRPTDPIRTPFSSPRIHSFIQFHPLIRLRSQTNTPTTTRTRNLSGTRRTLIHKQANQTKVVVLSLRPHINVLVSFVEFFFCFSRSYRLDSSVAQLSSRSCVVSKAVS